jgi:hypothetical protein
MPGRLFLFISVFFSVEVSSGPTDEPLVGLAACTWQTILEKID